MKFEEKILPSGANGVFVGGKLLGTYCDVLGGRFEQFSNEGQLFDVELAKEFMKTKTDKELVVDRGWSTSTQAWFKIIARG